MIFINNNTNNNFSIIRLLIYNDIIQILTNVNNITNIRIKKKIYIFNKTVFIVSK